MFYKAAVTWCSTTFVVLCKDSKVLPLLLKYFLSTSDKSKSRVKTILRRIWPAVSVVPSQERIDGGHHPKMSFKVCRGKMLPPPSMPSAAAALIIVVSSSLVTTVSCSSSRDHHDDISDDEKPSIELARLDWGHVGIYVTITLFIVLSGLAKVGE